VGKESTLLMQHFQLEEGESKTSAVKNEKIRSDSRVIMVISFNITAGRPEMVA